MRCWRVFVCLVVSAAAVPLCAGEIDFARDIQPLLKARCGACHGETKQKGGLRFDARAGALKKGDSGLPAVVPGKSDESELLARVHSTDETLRMPPEGERLTADEIALLKRWIDSGADWPDSGLPIRKAGLVITDEDRQHWSFRPLAPTPLPRVSQGAVLSEVDAFVLARLQAAQLTPSPTATPRVLVRRLEFDLLGLPPTPEEVAEFERDWSDSGWDAYVRLVDRLLASPHLGERWARHWLDVARYADSNGQEGDQDRPFAWPYRDFVIRAFNDDLPFDTFVRWQLAGDECEPDNPLAVAATGFLVAGPHTVLDVPMEEEKTRNRYNELDDMVSTIGTAFLGLTLGCARCHDHKYDAVSSRDYYSLLSAVHSGDRQEVPLVSRGELASLDKERQKSLPKGLVFRDTVATPKPTWLFERGNFYDRDEPVELGFLQVLTREKSPRQFWDDAKKSGEITSTFQRRAVADWMTDPEHGAGALAARVIVNRVWQHHFGEGLVRTPSDFGVQGDKPSHPELLEWLAHDFVAHGWRLKRLHRQVLLSAAYTQSTAWNDHAAKVDPDNRLLWRRRPLRLEAEVLRDAMLAAGGKLNPRLYGEPFKPPIPPEAIVARNLKTPYKPDPDNSPSVRRRSVYMFHKRVVPYPLMLAFDRPDALQSCGRRDATTVAPQALALLNDQTVRDRAADFAQRITREADGDEARVRRGFMVALGREPSAGEHSACVEFLASRREERSGRKEPNVEQRALADFCQMLLCLNEFLYVD